MICPVCGQRWAPFPEEDFEQNNLSAKTEGAEERRLQAYNSDREEYCGCNEEYFDALIIMSRDTVSRLTH